jgi:glycosyltransferase involved in cell wall biosynthesis
VRVSYRFASQVRPTSVLRIALDTAAIFYRHYVLGSYGAQAARGTGRDRPRLEPARPPVEGADGRLRILFLNWRDRTNPEAGGAEVFTHEVAMRWAAQGHEVTLLTSGFGGGGRNGTYDGVTVRRIGRLRSGTFHLALQRELATLNGFDVVVDGINTIPSLAALWRRRLPATVPLVFQLARDVWDSELPRPFADVGRWLEPKLLGPYRSMPAVAISSSTAEDLHALGFRDVEIVPPGRDEPPPLDGVAKEERPTLLFAGRLAQNKRPQHAVEAFRHLRRELPDARLWIAGHGPLEQSLAEQIPEGAELLGYVSRPELYERMRRAHCVLVPSVREGWGLVVIEAGSVGTPSVAYDVPGLRDSVQDGETGRLAAAGDPEALAGAALDLLADADAYRETCRLATEWASRFSWDDTASRLLDVVVRAVDTAEASAHEVARDRTESRAA